MRSSHKQPCCMPMCSRTQLKVVARHWQGWAFQRPTACPPRPSGRSCPRPAPIPVPTSAPRHSQTVDQSLRQCQTSSKLHSKAQNVRHGPGQAVQASPKACASGPKLEAEAKASDQRGAQANTCCMQSTTSPASACEMNTHLSLAHTSHINRISLKVHTLRCI